MSQLRWGICTRPIHLLISQQFHEKDDYKRNEVNFSGVAQLTQFLCPSNKILACSSTCA
jgi:hypothetical protein